jgi:hypothetical protein
MVGPNLAHSRIALHRVRVVPADTQPSLPPMGINAYLPAPTPPSLTSGLQPVTTFEGRQRRLSLSVGDAAFTKEVEVRQCA